MIKCRLHGFVERLRAVASVPCVVVVAATMCAPMMMCAQTGEPTDSLTLSGDIDELVVTARQRSTRKLRATAQNTDLISGAELRRAACCNLGESFSTNPSVDVSYSDAATGSKQIKLLGLSGAYVQMMTENIPNFRGAAAPYGLGYVAGPWMQSIQVSKGASSVKNGYESISGQINIEMLKPQTEQALALNAYADHMGKVEANATGNIHLSCDWSTGLLLHGEQMLTTHDENGDGFIDQPKVRQISAMNRWAYMSESYIFQAGAKFLAEERRSGEDNMHGNGASMATMPRYTIGIDTRRWEAFAKNAYIFDQEHDGNVALIVSGSYHNQNSEYGYRKYDVVQKNLYASLMYEQKYGDWHSLSVGASFNYDHYNQRYRLEADQSLAPDVLKESESVPGGYVQYTFNYDHRLLVMAGVRYDHSGEYGAMFTPRFHAKYTPIDPITIHASVGRGYRNAHRLADNSYLLASSRKIVIAGNSRQEKAWNMGGGVSTDLQLWDRSLTISGEYYYTEFNGQAVVDLDTNPHAAILTYNTGASHSHTAQVEMSYQPTDDITLSAAYRYTDVKENYGAGLVRKPLSSRYKALATVNYAPMMGIWQIDATLALNGGGRMPASYTTTSGEASWRTTYKAYPTLNLQVTRNFRHFAVYVGGENLTGYRQKTPIIDASNPWGDNFDATMVYAPIHGALGYIGVRYTFTKY